MKARRKQCFFLNAPELGGTTTMVKSGDVLKTAVAGERCGTEQKKIGILFKLLSRKEGNFYQKYTRHSLSNISRS